MAHFTTSNELFQRIVDMVHTPETTPIQQPLHDTLVLVCQTALADSPLIFGNLFAQVDYICQKAHCTAADTHAIQHMRRVSNRSEKLTPEERLQALRALALLVSAAFKTPIPNTLVGLLPEREATPITATHIDYRYMRGIVQRVSVDSITLLIDQTVRENPFTVKLQPHQHYLLDIVQIGHQLNLIDVNTAHEAAIIVFEPDFLVDISSIAHCFTDYGHHPFAYLLHAFEPSFINQPILLGYFAGAALDDIINQKGDYHWQETLKKSFKEQALAYCACKDLNQKEDFKTAAIRQTQHIESIVKALFDAPLSQTTAPTGEAVYNRNKAVLEPSFVCEALGLQGRVDLMTTDFKLLVEQKSGNNFNLQRQQPNSFGSYQLENHYVQLLLYYGVLRQNFNVSTQHIAMRLLYSKYPLPGGLVAVNFYQKLFRDAIALRNRIVAHEYRFGKQGFQGIVEVLSVDMLNEKKLETPFFQRWIQPQLNGIIAPLHALTQLEKAYFERMVSFVFSEQLAAKVGAKEGITHSVSDLWNMPLAAKKEAGEIYTDLTLAEKRKSKPMHGYDILTFNVPQQGENFLPNFRLGDLVYLYSYAENEAPDVRKALLFRGNLTEINSQRLTIQTANPVALDGKCWCVEHSSSDITTTSALKSLYTFITTAPHLRQLLLGQATPRADKTIRLSRSYHPMYDALIEKVFQAQDYFLLVGPPGTGKTSMALQFMVREAMAKQQTVLLMSYTNRAVDEICEMLQSNAIDYLRIGNAYTYDKRFRSHLLSECIDAQPQLSAIQERLRRQAVIVGTTSTLQSKAFLFDVKAFDWAIIDEASQILEPQLVGLLSHLPKFVLIGDHKQLPAVVQQDAEVSAVAEPLLHEIGLTNCRNALFERLITLERQHQRTDFVGTLRYQGRMHPAVAAFPNAMFYAEEQLQPVPLPHQTAERLAYDLPTEDALDEALKQHRVLFIPSKKSHEVQASDKVNWHEAQLVAQVLRRIHRFYGTRFDADKTVGVIVPYRNQIAMIRQAIEPLGVPALENISIDTVERYQGSQRDVMIYSFTVQHRYQLDFLTANSFEEGGRIIDRKLNVALTRARLQMICIGCEEVLKEDALFKKLIAHSASITHREREDEF